MLPSIFWHRFHANSLHWRHLRATWTQYCQRPTAGDRSRRSTPINPDHCFNGENSAAGFGIISWHCGRGIVRNSYIDVIATWNHVWDKREIIDYFQMVEGNGHGPARRVLRPANYPSDMPGSGLYEGIKAKVPYAVINLQGRVFMASNDDPFRTADQLLKKIQAKIILVDIHAEATSEKISLGWYLDGRVTAVVGTHTHVPTADERVLPNGTAYVTDVGMTGPYVTV